MNEQEMRNLDLLGTLHFVLGALTAAFSFFPLIHFFIGIAILAGGFNGGDQAPRVVGLIFVLLSLFIIILGLAMAVLIIISGVRLRQRRAYNFCLIISFIQCLIVPLGTVLGIFTIITLSKDSVKELFS
ncbi:MAG: hypothetical protein SCJ97_02655 [Bacillota bacterium]|nr:hypothetical protein [Bacillota bacterium]